MEQARTAGVALMGGLQAERGCPHAAAARAVRADIRASRGDSYAAPRANLSHAPAHVHDSYTALCTT